MNPEGDGRVSQREKKMRIGGAVSGSRYELHLGVKISNRRKPRVFVRARRLIGKTHFIAEKSVGKRNCLQWMWGNPKGKGCGYP